MLRVIDGFDYFPGDTTNISAILRAQGWVGDTGGGDSSTTTSTAFGYGRALRWTGNQNNGTRRRWLRGRYTDTMVFGMRMYVPTIGDDFRLRFYDSMSSASTNGLQFQLIFNSSGIIVFDGPGANDAQTYAFAFTPGKWFWLEIKVKPGYGTNGSIEIRVNTVPKLSLPNTTISQGSLALPATDPGIDFFGQYINRIGAGTSPAEVNPWAIDDFYFLDNTGSLNNDYLGNVRAKYMPAVSDYSVSWSIGGSAPAASNWQSVLNNSLDDAQYVYSATVGNRDLYGLDPNLNTPFVYGVEVSGAYKMDDATQRVVRNTINSAGSNSEGVDHYINQDYTFYPDIFETDPATGVPFTGAAANLLRAGPKVIV